MLWPWPNDNDLTHGRLRPDFEWPSICSMPHCLFRLQQIWKRKFPYMPAEKRSDFRPPHGHFSFVTFSHHHQKDDRNLAKSKNSQKWGFHLAHFHLAKTGSGESSPFVAGDYTQAARDTFGGQEQNLTPWVIKRSYSTKMLRPRWGFFIWFYGDRSQEQGILSENDLDKIYQKYQPHVASSLEW